MTNTETPLILHVDDDEDILAITRLALETVGGMSIIQCNSGYQAIEAARSHAPQFFLLDVMMPEIDGIETLRRIREIDSCRTTPAVFMTAKAMKDDRIRLLETGAKAVITKPFDPMTLSSEIMEIWRQSLHGDNVTKLYGT